MVVDFTNPNPNPNPNPPTPDGSIQLTMTMTDSWGDGWEGTVLAIRQNNVVVGTFGNLFTYGTSSGPVYITVVGNVEAQVVVSTLGGYTNEVGFVIKAPNGTIIHQRNSGSSFPFTILFKTFCPIGGCPVLQTVTYKVSTTDSWGDGWEGTVLAFKQDGAVVSTFTLASGSAGGPTDYTFKTLSPVNITVYVLGYYTNEVGFVIRNAAGSVVFQRAPGATFTAGTVLGTFCPECTNLAPVSILQGSKIK